MRLPFSGGNNIMKIKICGLTSHIEATYLNENNADYAGFVLFCPKSKRNITIDKAKEIASNLNENIKKVAVCVSPSLEEINLIDSLDFDYVHIHPFYEKDLLKKIKTPVIKAFNIRDLNEFNIYKDIDCVKGFVFDAAIPGSGKTFDLSVLSRIPKTNKTVFLAGGLSPENVSEIAGVFKPDVVDVSSGVEYNDRPGKDPLKIKTFCESVINLSKEE